MGPFVCSAVFISLLNGTLKSQKQGPSNVPSNAVFSGKVPSQFSITLGAYASIFLNATA